MMLPILVAICFVASGVSGGYQPLTSDSLAVFVKNFRAALLDKVALEVNNTVDLSNALKAKVDACKPVVEQKVTECKACAKSKCNASPKFTDILNLVNPYNYLKGPLDDIGSKVNIAVDLVEEKAGGFINSMKNLGSSIKIAPELKAIYLPIKAGIEKAINSLKSLGKSINNIVIDTGSIIGDKLGDFKDLFGKKRRKRAAITIDPKAKKCMAQCVSCQPFLLPTENELISAVCGKDIIQTNTTIQNQLTKIQTIYDHALDTVNAIVQKVEIDPTLRNANFDLTQVQITVYKNGAIQTYKSVVPVSMFDMVVKPARAMAMEYWANF